MSTSPPSTSPSTNPATEPYEDVVRAFCTTHDAQIRATFGHPTNECTFNQLASWIAFTNRGRELQEFAKARNVIIPEPGSTTPKPPLTSPRTS